MQAAPKEDGENILKHANNAAQEKQNLLFHTPEKDQSLQKLFLREGTLHTYDATLTSILLQELIASCLTHMGEDPLSKFETKVAYVDGLFPMAKYNTNLEIIVFNKPLLESLEFVIANAAFTNLCKRIRHYLTQKKEDPHNLAKIIDDSRDAIYSLVQSRLILHGISKRPLPKFASLLPKAYRAFIKRQLELCLVFVLLHEQAHKEFSKGENFEKIKLNLDDRIILESLSKNKREEFAADHWAIGQIAPQNRVTLMKAGIFFFFNTWSFDYLHYENKNDHPSGFNRIQALLHAFPEMKENDLKFFQIFANDLDRQQTFMQKLNDKTADERRSSLIRHCEGLAKYELFEDLVTSLSQTYDEIFLGNKGEP